MTNKTRVYGILFVSGNEGINIEAVASTLSIDISEVEAIIKELKLEFLNDSSIPFEITMVNHCYRLVTKSELEKDVEQFAQAPYSQQLTRAAIETLAIVAYRQPVTRMDIDQVRGVSSVSMIQKLLSRDLIKEIGRLEAPGRPVVYGVTEYFMDFFGLSSLEDLPEIEPLPLNIENSDDDLFSAKKWQVEFFDDYKES